MKMTLSTEEMLNQWRLRRALEPLRSDCTVERTDGIDLDSLLRLEMRDWYLKLLDTASLEYLAPVDLAGDVALSVGDDGVATVNLPERCRRVVEVMLDEWERPATILAPDSPLARCQQSVYSRGGSVAPVAVQEAGRLRLYSVAGQSPVITRLLCVAEPEDGVYTFDERALSLIGDWAYVTQ